MSDYHDIFAEINNIFAVDYSMGDIKNSTEIIEFFNELLQTNNSKQQADSKTHDILDHLETEWSFLYYVNDDKPKSVFSFFRNTIPEIIIDQWQSIINLSDTGLNITNYLYEIFKDTTSYIDLTSESGGFNITIYPPDTENTENISDDTTFKPLIDLRKTVNNLISPYNPSNIDDLFRILKDTITIEKTKGISSICTTEWVENNQIKFVPLQTNELLLVCLYSFIIKRIEGEDLTWHDESEGHGEGLADHKGIDQYEEDLYDKILKESYLQRHQLSSEGICLKEIPYIYYIPIKSHKKLLGYYIHGTAKKLTSTDKVLIDFFCKMILIPIDYEIQLSLERNALKSARIRNSIAAIMSRQMSHNLGSHVLPGVSNDIITKPSDDINPFGLVRFINYVQERMDFVSMIVNSDPAAVFLSNLNIKAHILDEICPDGPGIRHKGESELKNISPYLLKHIIKSEGFSRNTKKHFFDTKKESAEANALKPDPEELKNIEFRLLRKHGEDYKEFRTLGNNNPKELELFTDLEAAIPYGVNGRHAFLTLLENFIRNTAKHNRNALPFNEDLLITIQIDDFTTGETSHNVNEMFLITLFSNKLSTESELSEIKNVFAGNETEKKSIQLLTKEGELIQSYKGLKEMLICTAWIRNKMRDLSIIEEQFNNKYSSNDSDFIELKAEKSLFRYDLVVDPSSKSCNKHLGIKFLMHKYKFYHFFKHRYDAHSDSESIYHYILNLPAAEIYISDYNADSTEFKRLAKCLPRLISLSEIPENHHYKFTLNEQVNENLKILLFEIYLKQRLSINQFPNLYILHKNNQTSYKDEDRRVFRCQDDLGEIINLKKEAIVFKTHNDSPERYASTFSVLKESSAYKDQLIRSIEGISGGNFTYSAVMGTKINTLNYLRIVESSLCRIAIIDERLFQHNRGEYTKNPKIINSIDISQDLIEKCVQKIIESNANELNALIKWMEDNGLSLSNSDWRAISINKSDKSSIKQIITSSLNNSSANNSNIERHFLRSKGIEIFDYIGDEEGSRIINLDGEITNILPNDIRFLSIHYGIIQKFRNKDDNMNIGDKLKSFLNLFINDNTYKKLFIALHTGRGDLADLEYNVSFIPVSTLESLVNNSKHLLVQLFTNTKYHSLK